VSTNATEGRFNCAFLAAPFPAIKEEVCIEGKIKNSKHKLKEQNSSIRKSSQNNSNQFQK